MEFRILGSTEVVDGSRRIELPGGRGRALLTILILQAGEPVSADRLIDELWGDDPPATAQTVVQGLVAKLRKALEPDRRKGEEAAILQTAGKGYRLAIDQDSVDVGRFKRLIEEARAEPPEARSRTLSEALRLWRGPALADVTYEPFAQRAIAALEESRIQALEDRIDADLILGKAAEVVPELEDLAGRHPLRERLWSMLMVALYRSGRQADALQRYASARSILIEELGLEPGPALRDLHAAVLRQDPSLGGAVPSPSPASDEKRVAWLARERRTVTVVAIDCASAGEPAADPEALGHAGARAADVATNVMVRHGGRVERSIGDTMVGFFGFPQAHEDDARRAVLAALEARAAVAALNEGGARIDSVRTQVRAGIETGDIIVPRPGAALADILAGPLVAAAGRLMQHASSDEVLVGPSAQRLLRGSVIVQSTSSGAGTAWRILEVIAGAPGVPRELEEPMFGRQVELSRLRSAFRRAERSGLVRMTVLGEAGIGKSRLAKELVASIGSGADAITQYSPAHGEDAAFFPLRGAVVAAAGLRGWRGLHSLLSAETASRRSIDEISPAIHVPVEPETIETLTRAIRALFSALASHRALVVVYEDLHAAPTPFLDLVDRLVAEAADERIFMLCLARPELLERRPDWPSHDAITLEPLASDDVASLVLERFASIAPTDLDRIVELSHGNPLFAEQLLAELDDGDLAAIPASLRGLLTMRLDRLGPGERDVLRCASILGMELEPNAVAALVPDDAQDFVGRHLHALERKRLIKRVGENAFRFDHALIQLAAYNSMAREDRAQLHERLAQWLERRPSLERSELEYHRTLAGEHRRAIGAPSPSEAGGGIRSTGIGLFE